MRTSRGVTAAVLLLCSTACEKDPVDAALDTALDFSGVFQASDGTQIELDGDDRAVVLAVGSSPLGIGLRVGNPYMIGMWPTGNPGEYRGSVVGRTGLLDWGTVTISGSTLTIEREPEDAVDGQSSWTKIAAPTPPPPSGTDEDDSPTDGSATLLYAKDLEGALGSSTYYKVSVPAGATKLVVTTFEENEWGHNLGDLFVSRGQKPTVSSAAPYSYSAQCASINPNREDETCTFANPAAGDWYILLYGYHEYYGTSLKVTVE